MTSFSIQGKVAAFVVLATGAATGLAVGSQHGGANEAPPASATQPRHDHQHEALTYAFGHLNDRYESGSAVWIERDLADLLPNRKFAFEGKQPQQLSPGIVIGTVTTVMGGAGYAIEGTDADNGTQVAFDADNALWRVAELTVSVEE